MPFLRHLRRSWDAIMAVIVVLSTLGILPLVFGAGARLDAELDGLGSCAVIWLGALLMVLVPLVVARLIAYLVSAIVWFQRLLSGGLGDLPRLYRRSCRACGFVWVWRPDRPHRVRALRRSSPQGQRTEAQSTGKRGRRQQHALRARDYQPFLDELLAHWNGAYAPDATFLLPTPDDAVTFFRGYQRALGEDPDLKPGHAVTGFMRNHPPSREEILLFVRAYQYLRQGDRIAAVQGLHRLAKPHSQFADPWIWLSATAVEPTQRIECLERAVRLEPAHPLALDALAIARGEVPHDKARGHAQELEVAIARCTRCGGSLHFEPGASEVTCAHCGRHLQFARADPSQEAPLVTTLRLQRRHRGHTWQELERVLHCRACGAELATPHRLARPCAYCGSTNVLVEDDPHTIEGPDGLVPFKIDERRATNAIRDARAAGLGWSAKCNIRDIEGVYVPFWAFDGIVEVRWLSVDENKVPTSLLERQRDFDNLLFPGVDVPPPSLLDEVLPYNLTQVVPFEARLLANWLAQLYNRDVELAVEDAYDTMLAQTYREASSPVKTKVTWDSSTPAKERRTFQVSQVTYRMVLLPVWVATLESRRRHSLALVNGQTGVAVLGPPLSDELK